MLRHLRCLDAAQYLLALAPRHPPRVRIPRRYLIKAVVFPLVLGGILLSLKSLDNHADIGPYWRKLQDVKRVQPQTVFLGSSRTYRHIDPVRFDSLRGDGATSYNFGVPGSRALETHYRAERLLDEDIGSLERLVVEFGPVDVRAPRALRATRRVHHYHDARRAAIGARVAMASERPTTGRVLAAGDRWRTWVMNTFVVGWGRAVANSYLKERRRAAARPVGERGYVGLDLAAASPQDPGEVHADAVADGGPSLRKRREAYLEPEGQAEMAGRFEEIRARGAEPITDRDRVTAQAWLSLAERARARGVDVVFVEQPGTENNAGISALLRQELGEDAVIVLNDPERYPTFFDLDAWFDLGHLRVEQAERLTEILAGRVPPLPED